MNHAARVSRRQNLSDYFGLQGTSIVPSSMREMDKEGVPIRVMLQCVHNPLRYSTGNRKQGRCHISRGYQLSLRNTRTFFSTVPRRVMKGFSRKTCRNGITVIPPSRLSCGVVRSGVLVCRAERGKKGLRRRQLLTSMTTLTDALGRAVDITPKKMYTYGSQ